MSAMEPAVLPAAPTRCAWPPTLRLATTLPARQPTLAVGAPARALARRRVRRRATAATRRAPTFAFFFLLTTVPYLVSTWIVLAIGWRRNRHDCGRFAEGRSSAESQHAARRRRRDVQEILGGQVGKPCRDDRVLGLLLDLPAVPGAGDVVGVVPSRFREGHGAGSRRANVPAARSEDRERTRRGVVDRGAWAGDRALERDGRGPHGAISLQFRVGNPLRPKPRPGQAARAQRLGAGDDWRWHRLHHAGVRPHRQLGQRRGSPRRRPGGGLR